MKNAIFMIESGKPLEMVKQYIDEVHQVRIENASIAKDLGVEDIWTSRTTGAISGVHFPGEINPDFRKPKKKNGPSYPKKGTAWAKRFAEVKGTRDASCWIGTDLGIAHSLTYKSQGRNDAFGDGWRRIGTPLNECGFLWLTIDGPYAMWTPDVPAIIEDMASRGDIVTGPHANFKFNIEGARQILREEWEFMVAQSNLKNKMAVQ